ncbi:MAG: hypothetical protein RIQ60_3548 [Pseudomonadota bacterium]
MKSKQHNDNAGLMQLPLARRGFLSWCAAAAAPLLAGQATVSLTGCVLGGSDAATRPFADLTVLDAPSSLSISVQSRKVQWVPGRDPAAANAWVYLVSGSTAASGNGVLPNHLGPIINVRRDSNCQVTWANALSVSTTRPDTLALPPINSPDSADVCGNVTVQSDVALVTHLHGARVQGDSDGWPLTPLGYEGNPYGFPSSLSYSYPNHQRSAMLWYHDHAMDHTGRHVHAGLAGVYFIRDAADDALLNLVGGISQELPVVIQDRIQKDTGVDYAAGMPTVDPLARPEFLGTSIFVNGHPAGTISLARRTWRLRLLNASNARTYALALCNPAAIAAQSGQVWHSQCLRIVGADGGLLGRSVALGATDVIVLAPGQRRDVLIDLTALPAGVTDLRLVNLNLLATLAVDESTPEAIYTTFVDSVLPPTQASYTATDANVYAALNQPLTDVMRCTVADLAPVDAAAIASVRSPSVSAVDTLLANAAADDDFAWNGSRLTTLPNVNFGPNRLVVLMSNTEGKATNEAVSTISGWGDVQIFEMGGTGSDWSLPFDIDLAGSINPSAGGPSTTKGYSLARRSFFASETNADITTAKQYPTLHAPTIQCRGGTYERWYVTNLGNIQPQVANGNLPDMHPFHIHLVSFVVNRRWELDANGVYQPATALADDFDLVGRQDTVLVPSNQMVELLVYIPPGYTGKYAYHCHLLEHEDMCMMSHFEVLPAA